MSCTSCWKYRRKAVNLLYGAQGATGFRLPGTIVILATMNTADRSIALVDAAMRRRFWFQELHPSSPPTSELLGRWLAERGLPDDAARLLAELNRRTYSVNLRTSGHHRKKFARPARRAKSIPFKEISL